VCQQALQISAGLHVVTDQAWSEELTEYDKGAGRELGAVSRVTATV